MVQTHFNFNVSVYFVNLHVNIVFEKNYFLLFYHKYDFFIMSFIINDNFFVFSSVLLKKGSLLSQNVFLNILLLS